jgi:hypothetical protein
LNALDGGRIGTALVNVDLLGHTVQPDGLIKKASCGCEIALGTEQKVNRVAIAVDRSVHLLDHLAQRFNHRLVPVIVRP